jgi:enoyl-CoA hydratase/carnithine racemase
MSSILESERSGRVLRIVLNRPEKRNALNADMCRQLVRTLEIAQNDPAVGAILLSARGSSFCAGMDLSEVGSGESEELNLAHEQLFTAGARLVKPIVAAVEGPALGGGMGLVANCHVVVASEGATFGLTEIRLGLWPFLVFRAVAAALGERRTTSLALTARILHAAEARDLGLIDEVTTHTCAHALDLAQAVAGFSPTSIRNGMRYVQESRGLDWRQTGEIARRIRNEVFRSADFQEGIRAFREKRSPRWPSLD